MKQMKTWKNLIYHGKCPGDNHVDEYIGETNRRIPERIKDHKVKDASSCLLRHSIESGSRNIYVYPRDILQLCLFQVMVSRTIPWKEESKNLFLITQKKSTLNKQEKILNSKFMIKLDNIWD